MLSKEITLGGYLPGDSIIHRLDPRTKLLGLCVLLAIVFLVSEPYRLIFPLTLAGAVILLTRLGWRVWANGLMKFKLMLLVTLVLNFVWDSDGTPIQLLNFVTPFSYEGLENTLFLVARIALAIIFSLALTFSTLPWDIVKGLQFFLGPLRMFGISVGETSLVLFLALRFVPLLQEEWRRLIEAQESRGIDFGSGSLSNRTRRLMAVIIPSMLLAFRKSEELSTAMSARGFRPGEKRTEYRTPMFSSVDAYAGIIIVVGILSIVIY